MSTLPRIGVIAPSSVVPSVELSLSVAQLRAQGFDVGVHSQVKKKHLFFAGTDDERARAFFEYATDPDIDILWCARGGSGAMRLLPYLDRLSAERSPPARKLLVGYSDATLLMEYTRNNWGWSTLHGPMLALRDFVLLKKQDLQSLYSALQKEAPAFTWERTRLKAIYLPSDMAGNQIEAEVIGGNLAVWAAVIGTPYEVRPKGQILFLEEVAEPFYRIERMVSQLAQAGHFKGAKGLILGTFENCQDTVPSVLKSRPKLSGKKLERILKSPKPSELKPLRAKHSPSKLIELIFAAVGKEFGIPVYAGLPVGHGPAYPPFPVGARYRVDSERKLHLTSWDWLE